MWAYTAALNSRFRRGIAQQEVGTTVAGTPGESLIAVFDSGGRFVGQIDDFSVDDRLARTDLPFRLVRRRRFRFGRLGHD